MQIVSLNLERHDAYPLRHALQEALARCSCLNSHERRCQECSALASIVSDLDCLRHDQRRPPIRVCAAAQPPLFGLSYAPHPGEAATPDPAPARDQFRVVVGGRAND